MHKDTSFVPNRLGRAIAGYRYNCRHAKRRIASKSVNLDNIMAEAEIEGRAGFVVYGYYM